MRPKIKHIIINNVEHKQCSKCKQYKKLDNFVKSKTTWDGYNSYCKDCKKLQRKYVHKKPKDKTINGNIYRLCSTCTEWKEKHLFNYGERVCKTCISSYNNSYYISNKTSIQKYNTEYFKKHKHQISLNHKIWAENNQSYLTEYGKKYREKNKNKLREYDKKKHHKYKQNINYKLTKNLRRRTLYAIKNNSKSDTTLNLIGCDIEEFKIYIEKLFKPGMTWDNYGKWEIDHITPCASFDLSKPEEQQKCFHYTNLQPLWKEENLKKGKKII